MRVTVINRLSEQHTFYPYALGMAINIYLLSELYFLIMREAVGENAAFFLCVLELTGFCWFVKLIISEDDYLLNMDYYFTDYCPQFEEVS